jgi:hypothetical protein
MVLGRGVADMVSGTLTAAFTSPEVVPVDPRAILWMLPLAASIAVVYKATKLGKLSAVTFVREVAVLFGSIVAFIVVAGVVLFFVARLVTE